MPAAVQVVELALGDGVVDVDRGEAERTRPHHLVQAVHAGRGLLGHAAHALGELRPASGVLRDRAPEQLQDHAPLLGLLVGIELGNRTGCFELRTLVNQQRGVAAVIENEVGPRPVGPEERLLGAPPVLFERLPLPCEDGDPLRLLDAAIRPDHGRRRGMILRRENVAGHPAHVRAEVRERLDQHCRLHRHVQRTHDAGAGQRTLGTELLAQRHESWHLVLRQPDLFAAELGQRQVPYLERRAAGLFGSGEALWNCFC